MAGMYEANQTGKRQEIADKVYNSELEATPVLSMLGVGKEVLQSTMQWQMEKFADKAVTGVLDGTAVTAFDSTLRYDVYGAVQQIREAWQVTQRAENTAIAGVPDEVGRQRYTAMINMRRKQEKILLSDQDHQVEAASDPWLTRGMFKYIQAGAQTTFPVPALFRNASAAIYGSTVALLTQSAFEALLAAAGNEIKGPVSLDLFAGPSIKSKIDSFTEIWPTATSTETLGAHYNRDAAKGYVREVNILRFSYGTVRVGLSWFNLCDLTTGLATASTPLSAIGINPEMWNIGYMRNGKPANTNLSPDGSGVRGFIDCFMGLRCNNTLGQIKIVATS